ncbi:MAG: hypothetical protein JWO56_2910 [Acidobacteria bacterium]|nr:hypothetical protein [Acidobacteriota bacterium]
MAVQTLNDHEAVRARRFLLGQLPAGEAELFEARLLEDGELFELVQAVEDGLFDAFARDGLSADERQALAPRVARQPERLRFAKALAQRTDERVARRAAGRATTNSGRWWPAAAAAAIVLVAGAGLWWRLTPAPPSLSVPVTATSEPKAPAPAVALRRVIMASYTIVLATPRGEGELPRLGLRPDVTDVALSIRLHPADRFPFYDVAVRRSDATPLWTGRVSRRSADGITVIIPAALLPAGQINVAVEGIESNGRRELLGDQMLQIGRRSSSP